MTTMLRSLLIALLLTAPAAAQQLPPAGGYDSQLGGAYPPPAGVAVVSRDREDPPAPGLYNICYVNAFQTQPQDGAWWAANHPDLLLRNAAGQPVEDENWPGELLLDTGTAEKREALAAIVDDWIAGCASAGFDAIEADNLDTYARSGGRLSMADNLAYAGLLVQSARAYGLAFGQKNAAELLDRAKAAGFSFAIVESCQVYDECDAFTAVYGRHVLEIEYTDTPRRHFETACASRGGEIAVVLRDRQLTTPASPDYRYETCR
jgi:hypothetical protein